MATRITKSIIILLCILPAISCKEYRKQSTDSKQKVEVLHLANKVLPEDSSEVDYANEVFNSWLSIDVNQKEVIDNIGEPYEKGEDEYWGATGMYVQEWRYPSLGLVLEMESEELAGGKTVLSILLIKPSVFETKRGIRIGSSINDVKHQYREEIDHENSDDSIIVVGSIYGGIVFYFENGIVQKYFIGAAAE